MAMTESVRLWALLLTAGCAGGNAIGSPPVTGATRPGTPVAEPFADRPPGPIAGSFRVTCSANEGEIFEFTVNGNRAVGRVADPGTAEKYGFKRNEEAFKLAADSYGDWVGQVRFRSVTGAEHWDGIRLVATVASLNATMTNEPCYRSMPRVR